MKNYYLLPGLDATPRILRRTLALVSPEKLRLPTHPDRFSPLEVMCHLNDWEPIMREERMKTAFTNPGGSFLAYDEAVKAVEGRYSERNLEEQMAEFERERTKTVEFVKSLSEADWGKTAFHPDRGMMTLCEIVHMVVCHDVYHIEQLWAVVD